MPMVLCYEYIPRINDPTIFISSCSDILTASKTTEKFSGAIYSICTWLSRNSGWRGILLSGVYDGFDRSGGA